MEQKQSIKSIIGNYESFLDKVLGNLKKAGFDLSEFKEVDHIAYRTENLEQYEKAKKELLGFSKFHDESMFRGRLISVFRLEDPLVHGHFAIDGIELLAPKENNRYREGLEHAEFVTKTTLPEFREKHHDIDFDLKAYSKEENPELVLDFGSCAVKFHAQSLLELRKI